MKQSLKFVTSDELRRWFQLNYLTSPGLWIRFDSKERVNSILPEDALMVALSYGWVEDRIKRINDTSYRRKFIPRRDGSVWTDAQKALVSDLTDLGLMEKPGLDAIARAKFDGSWNSAAISPVTDVMLETLTSALRPYESAFLNFLRMSPSSQRTYAVSYCSAKRPDTRARRLASIVEKLNAMGVPKKRYQK